jgi:plastocyanin
MKANRNMYIIFLAIVIVIVAIAAIIMSSPKPSNGSSQGNGVPVSITGSFSFSPTDLTIHPGQNVTWTNNAGVTHTVVSDSSSAESFSSGALNNGQTFTYEFDHIGNFSYHCSIHPSMTGTIHVIA